MTPLIDHVREVTRSINEALEGAARMLVARFPAGQLTRAVETVGRTTCHIFLVDEVPRFAVAVEFLERGGVTVRGTPIT